MRTKILGVRIEDIGVLVCFRTDTGMGCALWASKNAPDVGREYSVELDVDGSIADFSPAKPASCSIGIAFSGGATTLIGVLESVDADGMGYVRLGTDCLLMIETSPGWNDPGALVALSLQPTSLRITPMDT